MTTKNNLISDADYAKIERMSKLSLDPNERVVIHSQLDEALKAVAVFDKLDLKDVPPLEHPGGLKNVMREDVVTPSFTQDQALKNAKDTYEGYIVVPGLFEDQS